MTGGFALALSACVSETSKQTASGIEVPLRDIVTITGVSVSARGIQRELMGRATEVPTEQLTSVLQSALDAKVRGLGNGSDPVVLNVEIVGLTVAGPLSARTGLATEISANLEGVSEGGAVISGRLTGGYQETGAIWETRSVEEDVFVELRRAAEGFAQELRELLFEETMTV